MVAITLVCGAALWKGGPTERWAATLYYVCWLITRLVYIPDWYATQWGMLAVDIVLLAAMVVLVLRSDRYWPIFMTAFHLLAVLTHMGRMLDRGMPAWAYYTAAQIWGYMVLYSIVWGTWTAWRERRQANAAAPTPTGATRR